MVLRTDKVCEKYFSPQICNICVLCCDVIVCALLEVSALALKCA